MTESDEGTDYSDFYSEDEDTSLAKKTTASRSKKGVSEFDDESSGKSKSSTKSTTTKAKAKNVVTISDDESSGKTRKPAAKSKAKKPVVSDSDDFDDESSGKSSKKVAGTKKAPVKAATKQSKLNFPKGGFNSNNLVPEKRASPAKDDGPAVKKRALGRKAVLPGSKSTAKKVTPVEEDDWDVSSLYSDSLRVPAGKRKEWNIFDNMLLL